MKAILYRLLLVCVLVSVQFLVITSGDVGMLFKKDTIVLVDNVQIVKSDTLTVNNQASNIAVEQKVNESVQTTPTVNNKQNNIAIEKQDKVTSNIEEEKNTQTQTIVSNTDTIIVDDNTTVEIIQNSTKKGSGKILTMELALIRDTPILDKTKTNVVYSKSKGIVINYKEELDDWYLLYDNKYIHKSVVKKLQ